MLIIWRKKLIIHAEFRDNIKLWDTSFPLHSVSLSYLAALLTPFSLSKTPSQFLRDLFKLTFSNSNSWTFSSLFYISLFLRLLGKSRRGEREAEIFLGFSFWASSIWVGFRRPNLKRAVCVRYVTAENFRGEVSVIFLFNFRNSFLAVILVNLCFLLFLLV